MAYCPIISCRHWLSFPSTDFLQGWGLNMARRLQDFYYFFQSQPFVSWTVCLGSMSCWKTQPLFIFYALTGGRRFWFEISLYITPLIFFINTEDCSCPLCTKTAQKQDVSTPMLYIWHGVFCASCGLFTENKNKFTLSASSSTLVWILLSFSY